MVLALLGVEVPLNMGVEIKDERSINDVVAYINTLEPSPTRTAMKGGR